MNTESIHNKASLRRRFAALRDGLSPDGRTAAEAAIRDKLFSLPAWQNSPLICGYVSMRSEMDMMPIWERAIAEGKGYALPVTVTNAREGQMIFRRLSEFAPDRLIPGRFGILEPPPECPVPNPSDFENALILVPGLAFDDEGFRIGYGGGYYDRFLAALKQNRIPFTTVGLVFAACRDSALPHESHDVPVDYVIDERRITPTHGFRDE